jgi:hypothetical protein
VDSYLIVTSPREVVSKPTQIALFDFCGVVENEMWETRRKEHFQVFFVNFLVA